MMQMPMQSQPQGYHQPQTLEEVRTLWIGDLQYWVEENYLTNCFSQTGELVSVKVIRSKITGQPEGYGFIEFISHAAAERALQTYTGTQMPGTEINFRLNWASFGTGQKVDAGPEHSIFVGDLAPDVTDYLLQETFRVHYSSVRGAKVVMDPSTGRSKGYGFVKFADEREMNKAMSEMNGLLCSTRAMRISVATPKKNVGVGVGVQQQLSVYPVAAAAAAAAPVAAYVAQPTAEVDATATTEAWATQADPNQWNGYYGYGQGYDAYAYGTTQDAYGGYAYPQYQQGEGTQEIMNSTAGGEQELYDPLATPNVDKLNACYLSVHASTILGRVLWERTSAVDHKIEQMIS